MFIIKRLHDKSYAKVTCKCRTGVRISPLALESHMDLMCQSLLTENYKALAENSRHLGKCLPLSHLVHRKSYMDCPGIEPGPPWQQQSD